MAGDIEAGKMFVTQLANCDGNDGVAKHLAAKFEHGRNRWMAIVSDALAEFDVRELGDAMKALVNNETFSPLWEIEPSPILASLAMPTLLAEIQRRMELQDLRADDT